MSSSKPTVKEKGKTKAQILDPDKLDTAECSAVNASTPSSMLAKKSRVPQPINAETTAPSVRSLSRSPVQDSKISLGKLTSTQPTITDRRSSLSFAVSGSTKPPLSARPSPAYMPSSGAMITSQSSPTVYIPSSSPVTRGIHTATSTPIIAQSMLTGFKYDPNDKTPPRRKMAAANEASSSLSSMRVTKRRPLFTAGPNGEALVTPASSSQAGWSSATHDQAGTVTAATLSSHLEADLADFRKVVEAAKGPHDPNRQSESSITRQPYKIAKKLDPSDIEERIQRANCVTHLERLGEPHTRLSTMTDCSIPFFWPEKPEPEAESSSVHVSFQDVQDIKTSESILASNISPTPSLRNSCSSAQESHTLSHTASQKSKASDTLTSCLPTEEISQEQPLSKDQVAVATSGHLVSDWPRSLRHGLESPVNPGGRCNSLPDLRDRSMLVVPGRVSESGRRDDGFSTHLSTPFPVASLNYNGATSGALLGDTSNSRSDVEAQKRPPGPCRLPLSLAKNQGFIKEKALSTFSSRFCVDWPNFWCFVAKAVLVATFLTFMIIALVSISKTKPYSAPSDLFISFSKTMTSEDGSSNLTMSWVGGQAVGFRVSPSYNLTLDPNEPKPDEIRFRFDWSAEGLGILSGDRKLLSSMPIPSFEKKLTELVGFLGLFLLIFLIVRNTLRLVSKLGHQRENCNLHITTNFLVWFDKGIDWVSLILGVVGSTMIWARATLVLLLW